MRDKVTYIRLLIAAAVFLFVSIGVAMAGESADGFLSKLLTDEFNAGNSVRLGHIIFTDGKGSTTGDCDCSEPRELFYAEGDLVVVVGGWRIAGAARKTPKGMVVPVCFLVLATSEWETPSESDNAFNVKYVPLLQPRWETVNYLLRYRKGQWFVVNEPLPRVGIEPLIRVIHARLDDRNEVLNIPDLDNVSRKGAERARAHYQRQLSVLEPLRVKHE